MVFASSSLPTCSFPWVVLYTTSDVLWFAVHACTMCRLISRHLYTHSCTHLTFVYAFVYASHVRVRISHSCTHLTFVYASHICIRIRVRISHLYTHSCMHLTFVYAFVYASRRSWGLLASSHPRVLFLLLLPSTFNILSPESCEVC